MSYLRLFGIGGAALALVWLGWFLGSRVATAELAKERAAAAHQQALNDDLAIATLKTQLADSKAIAAHNSEVIRALESKTVSAESERDMATRLLDAARRTRPSASARVPEAADRRAAPGASGALSDEPLRDLLAAASAECKRNANRLDALRAEIKPQT